MFARRRVEFGRFRVGAKRFAIGGDDGPGLPVGMRRRIDRLFGLGLAGGDAALFGIVKGEAKAVAERGQGPLGLRVAN